MGHVASPGEVKGYLLVEDNQGRLAPAAFVIFIKEKVLKSWRLDEGNELVVCERIKMIIRQEPERPKKRRTKATYGARKKKAELREHIYKNPELTHKELAKKVGVGLSTIDKYIKALGGVDLIYGEEELKQIEQDLESGIAQGDNLIRAIANVAQLRANRSEIGNKIYTKPMVQSDGTEWKNTGQGVSICEEDDMGS